MIAPDQEAVAERHTQLLRGVLDMCLLAPLAEEPSHGYELARRLISMRRLAPVADEPERGPTGPQRKVYGLTEEAPRTLGGWATQWTEFADMVNATLVDTVSPSTSDAER